MGNYFSSTNYYTMEEIRKHNTENSCWLIVDNKVYDVTEIMNKHPPGKKPILNKAGGNATQDFHFHSKNTQKIWKKFCIGKVIYD